VSLVLTAVTRHYGGVRALDGATFEVQPGEVHGLIGPNGAGKTTLLNVVSGLVPPTSGTLTLGGRSIGGLPAHRVAALGVSRTYQNLRLFGGLTAEQNVVVGAHLRRRAGLWPWVLGLSGARAEEEESREQAREGLRRVGLHGRAQDRASDLSYGEQRRVEIARALAAGPSLLLLDEPTAGMNPPEAEAVATLVRAVAREGRAVLLIEHNVRLVMSLCDRITVLDFGKVIARGTPAEIGRDPRVIAAYLGDEAVDGRGDAGQTGGR
jgi:branched-chain amino acid transport system permease protein